MFWNYWVIGIIKEQCFEIIKQFETSGRYDDRVNQKK